MLRIRAIPAFKGIIITLLLLFSWQSQAISYPQAPNDYLAASSRVEVIRRAAQRTAAAIRELREQVQQRGLFGDPEAVRELLSQNTGAGILLPLATQVEAVRRDGDGLRLVLADGLTFGLHPSQAASGPAYRFSSDLTAYDAQGDGVSAFLDREDAGPRIETGLVSSDGQFAVTVDEAGLIEGWNFGPGGQLSGARRWEIENYLGRQDIRIAVNRTGNLLSVSHSRGTDFWGVWVDSRGVEQSLPFTQAVFSLSVPDAVLGEYVKQIRGEGSLVAGYTRAEDTDSPDLIEFVILSLQGDIAYTKPVAVPQEWGEIELAGFSPDGRYLAVLRKEGDEPGTIRSITREPRRASLVEYSKPAGYVIDVVTGNHMEQFRPWNKWTKLVPGSGRATQTPPRDARVVQVSFNHDATQVALVYDHHRALLSELSDRRVQLSRTYFSEGGVWQGQRVGVPHDLGRAARVAYSPVSDLLLTVEKSGRVHIQDSQTGRVIEHLEGPPHPLEATFSEDGRYIRILSKTGELWSRSLLAIIHARYKVAGRYLHGEKVTIAPNADLIATVDDEGRKVFVRDLTTWAVLGQAELPVELGAPKELRFSGGLDEPMLVAKGHFQDQLKAWTMEELVQGDGVQILDRLRRRDSEPRIVRRLDELVGRAQRMGAKVDRKEFLITFRELAEGRGAWPRHLGVRANWLHDTMIRSAPLRVPSLLSLMRLMYKAHLASNLGFIKKLDRKIEDAVLIALNEEVEAAGRGTPVAELPLSQYVLNAPATTGIPTAYRDGSKSWVEGLDARDTSEAYWTLFLQHMEGTGYTLGSRYEGLHSGDPDLVRVAARLLSMREQDLTNDVWEVLREFAVDRSLPGEVQEAVSYAFWRHFDYRVSNRMPRGRKLSQEEVNQIMSEALELRNSYYAGHAALRVRQDTSEDPLQALLDTLTRESHTQLGRFKFDGTRDPAFVIDHVMQRFVELTISHEILRDPERVTPMRDVILATNNFLVKYALAKYVAQRDRQLWDGESDSPPKRVQVDLNVDTLRRSEALLYDFDDFLADASKGEGDGLRMTSSSNVVTHVRDELALALDEAVSPQPLVYATAAPLPVIPGTFRVELLEAGDTRLVRDEGLLELAPALWRTVDGRVDLASVSDEVRRRTGLNLAFFLPYGHATEPVNAHRDNVIVVRQHLLETVEGFVARVSAERDLSLVEQTVLEVLLKVYVSQA